VSVFEDIAIDGFFMVASIGNENVLKMGMSYVKYYIEGLKWI